MARLAEMSTSAQHRVDDENTEERDARLGEMRVRSRQSIFNETMFAKVNTFHKKCQTDFKTCQICNESFPADNPNSHVCIV